MTQPDPDSPTMMSREDYEHEIFAMAQEYDSEFIHSLAVEEYKIEPDLSPNRTDAIKVVYSEEWDRMWDPISPRKQTFFEYWEDNSTIDAFFIACVGRECLSPQEMNKFLDSLTPRKEVKKYEQDVSKRED